MERTTMTEVEFLEHYDISAFDRPSVATDVVMMSVLDGHLSVLLQARTAHPFLDHMALPGGFVGLNESVEQAAARVLSEKVGVSGLYLEQLFTFGDIDRDPRGRVISVVYLALVKPEFLKHAAQSGKGGIIGRVSVTNANVQDDNGQPFTLAFDHDAIIAQAVARIQGKIEYLPISLHFFPELFTLRDLQIAHEAVLGHALNKPAFRRKILDTGWIEGTGQLEGGTSFRPAELYRAKL
jgi:8-oxo-dGTP diphosphatase